MESDHSGNTPGALGAREPSVPEGLLTWDELTPAELARLAADPEHGPKLRWLQSAEGWLEDGAPRSACPPTEELYDYGRGPGFRRLPEERRLALADHLASCPLCAGFCATLASAPPPPLELRPDAERSGLDREVPVFPIRRARWIPLAAAAAVLIGGLTLFGDRAEVSAATWPDRPLLRRSGDEALWFPRGRVLPSEELLFELAPVPGATRYRVLLRSHGESGFDRGVVVREIEADEPALALDEPLERGSYTWEAYAVVNGLAEPRGERDFQVVDDPKLRAALASDAPLARVRRLHEAGYVTDARRAARAMPPSPEREAYLAPPGR